MRSAQKPMFGILWMMDDLGSVELRPGKLGSITDLPCYLRGTLAPDPN